MYLRVTAQGHRADELGRLLGRFPQKLFIRQPPNARLRLIMEASSPGSISFTLLAYPEPASEWPAGAGSLQIVDYVKTRVEALSPLFRSFLDSAFGSAIMPVVRHELVHTAFDLQAEIAPLAVSFRNPRIKGFFEPLGYRVEVESPVFGLPAILVRLIGRQSIPAVLRHIFVIVPALDQAKQPPLTVEQAERLRDVGRPWLEKHPKRDAIARSYRLRPSTLISIP
ncbi:MAG: hypothetical protein KGJ86_04045 [Chloroflexota bacterium]|nr:hypothetical protein [Chloroflexota bacterium]